MARLKNYKKFEQTKGGIVFARNYTKRIETALKIAKKYQERWDYLLWVASANLLDIPAYKNKIISPINNGAERCLFFAFEELSLNDQVYLRLYDMASDNRVFCIIDDCLNIKNSASGRTKRLLSMQDKFDFRLLLSENPVCRGLRDVYALMQFMDASLLNMTETQFLHQFMPFYTDDFDVSKRWSKPKFERQAMKLLNPYILFCDLKDNLKINYREYWFDLTDKEKIAYRQDKERFLQGKMRVLFLQAIQEFQYLYTICQKKVEKLAELLDDIEQRKEKVIIYTKYLGEVKFLRESGLLKGKKYVIMSGMSDRKKAAQRFEKDYDVMICTYKVEIPRLILKGCANLIYFSQTFDYKDKTHILSRFYGDDELSLSVYDFWVNSRLETLIKDNLIRKKKLLQNVCKSMSSGEVGCL